MVDKNNFICTCAQSSSTCAQSSSTVELTSGGKQLENSVNFYLWNTCTHTRVLHTMEQQNQNTEIIRSAFMDQRSVEIEFP